VNTMAENVERSYEADDEQAWGAGVISRIALCLALPAVIACTFVIGDLPLSETWPAFVVAGWLALAGVRGSWSVRLTRVELLIRYPIGGRRIDRAQVLSARFNPFGLIIRMRDGGKAFAFLAPKASSTELSSGGVPDAGSAAYQITAWAAGADETHD
jgi:hypothetical protein